MTSSSYRREPVAGRLIASLFGWGMLVLCVPAWAAQPAEPPGSSDTVIVNTVAYNAAERRQITTDNAGIKTRRTYDALGRMTELIENYDETSGNGTPLDSEPDKNRTTSYTYNAAGQILTQTADLEGTANDQTTTYVYAASLSASHKGCEVPNNNLLRAIIYPDSSDSVVSEALSPESGGNRIEVTYYSNGSLHTRTDQRGVTLTYKYDDDGTRLSQAVSGTTVEGDRKVSYTYTDLQQRATIATYSDADGTALTSQITYTYNGLGQVTSEEQERLRPGTPTANYTGTVEYAYDTTAPSDAFTKGHRRLATKYPNGRIVHQVYGASGSIADTISRVTALAGDGGSTNWPIPDDLVVGDTIVEYEFLGSGTPVTKAYPGPSVKLSTWEWDGSEWDENPLADDTSGGRFDRLGRVVRHHWGWVDTSGHLGGTQTAPDSIFHIGHTYDRVSNVEAKTRNVYSGTSPEWDMSETYTYDDLHRLITATRPGMDGSHMGTSERLHADDWTSSNDGFGTAFDMSGTTAVAGAFYRTEGGHYAAGTAYILTYNGNTWSQQKITSDAPGANHMFGRAVSISGDTVAVGEYGANKVHIYTRGQSGWMRQTTLTETGSAAYGSSLTLNGDRLLVADPYASSYQGTVYVYQRDANGTWAKEIELPRPAGTIWLFGCSVGLDGDTAVIGSVDKAFIYKTSDWASPVTLNGPADSSYGLQVATSRGVVAVGAHNWSPTPQLDHSGAVYIYRYNEGTETWDSTRLVAADPALGDLFGHAIALEGDTLCVGAPGEEDGSRELIYTYHYEGSNWVEHAKDLSSDLNFSWCPAPINIRGPLLALAGQGLTEHGVLNVADTRGDVTGAKLDRTWTLNALGNQVAVRDGSASQSFQYGPANELTHVDSSNANIAHDAAGNMTRIPRFDGNTQIGYYECTYDAWNRLLTVSTHYYDGQRTETTMATPLTRSAALS
jgi:YD repeat-containing protein